MRIWNSHQIPFDEIWLHDKPVAMAYIDDRGLRLVGDRKRSNWLEIVGISPAERRNVGLVTGGNRSGMAIFTLEEARALLPQIKEVTQRYYNIVEELRESLQNPDDAAAVKRLETRINAELQQVGRGGARNCGVEVKGLWLADFDSGDGYYYCWQLGEDDIEHFHRYETGFAGRRPIELLG